ncbi:pyruvate, water dikinase regulatory protein [Aminivibrio sp.]|uniref:pyruvate, water dikinase regulatory protein n=1 Tax=Aminivibrio sp. TaxID=1872489 RepID=UPI00345E12C3
METLNLLIVSDSTGETAEHVALAAISQFDTDFSKIIRYRYVEGPGRIDEIVSRALTDPSIIICTLVDRQTRSALAQKSARAGVPCVDLLGPIVDALEKRLERPPLQSPGLLRKLDEDYFKKIKAVEFAIQCDDGRGIESLPEADVVILGVSRTGKTPLSMYIANKGFKAANIPLIPEVDPPEAIKDVPSSKLVGLIISAERLIQIRQERLRLLGLEPSASAYASRERVEREIRAAVGYLKSLGARIYDVTDRAVEETAQEILDVLRSR